MSRRRKQIIHVTDSDKIRNNKEEHSSNVSGFENRSSTSTKTKGTIETDKNKSDTVTGKVTDMKDEEDPERICSVCNAMFTNVTDFESHLLKHNLYLCPSCERCFKYKRSYQNHRFLCEEGISKVSKPKNSGVSKKSIANGVQANGVAKTVQDERSTSKDYSPSRKKKLVEVTEELITPDQPETVAHRSSPGQVSIKCEKEEQLPTTQISENRLPAKKRKTVTVEEDSDGLCPETNHDCDLRTLALAAASVSPHSKAAVEAVTESESVSNRSSLSSPFKIKDSFHVDSDTRSTFTPQFMLPSAFVPPNGNPREPAFTWQGIEIQSETNIISRMDGYNPATEQHYVLYKCCLCSNAFPNLNLLVSHLPIHGRGPKEHGCDKCGAVFKWRSQLEVHEQVHMVMDNMAMSQVSLLSPTHSINGSAEEDKPRDFSKTKGAFNYPALPTSPFYPVFPTANYATNSECNKTKHGAENLEVIADTANKMNRVPAFQCNYCTKRFDRLFSMQRHERIHTGVKPCFCKQCGRGFSERRNLRHHVIRFHSDPSQREPSRRGRKPKNRAGSNPSHKLVSFLKKTAVRILNTMEQSKYGVPDPFSNDVVKSEEPLNCTNEDRSQDAPLSLMVNQKHNNVDHDKSDDAETYMEVELDPEMVISNKGEDKLEEDVTVVIPTDVSVGKETDTTDAEVNNQREVLQDPKRSLIGSRRKGRPFRYAPSQSSQNGSANEDEGISNSDLTPPLTIVKEEIDPGSEDNNSNFSCQFQYTLPGKENSDNSPHKYHFPGETNSQFKARLRGHGTFFSNYNPSPVMRSEACRPQVGPDGKYVFPCSYCYKTFCSTSDLNRHMDFHEDVRPFKCPYCNYYSRTNSQLKVHTMRHEGIKQFLCSLCNYNGVTQSDLNRHCKTRTHVLRARNCCLTCGVGFYTRTLLEEHLRLVNHCALDYGLVKKEQEDSDLAEVRVISDSEPAEDNSTSNETNNNDYAFGSKNADLSFRGKPSRSSPVQDIPLYLGQQNTASVES